MLNYTLLALKIGSCIPVGFIAGTVIRPAQAKYPANGTDGKHGIGNKYFGNKDFGAHYRGDQVGK